MAQPLTFQLALTETFGARLNGSVNPALAQTDKLLGKTAGSTSLLEEAIDSAGKSGGKAGRFFTFDLAHGAELAIGMVEKLAGAFVGLGKDIVKTAGEAQDINLAVRLNVGEEGAKEIQTLADKFASVTRYDDDRIKSALLPLLEGGFKDTGLLSDITATAADLATRTHGQIGLEEAIDAFHKVGLKGEIDPKILRALNIGQAEFFEDLGKKFGVTAESAKELASKGKLDKVDLINAALDAVAKRTGGSIGGAAVEGGKTLGSTLERLQNAPGNLFKKIADSPGIKSIQGFLDNVVEIMTGEIGGALAQHIDDVFGTLFGDLSGPDGLERLKVAAVGVVDGIGSAVTSFKEAWPDIKEGFSTLWDIAKGIADAFKSVNEFLQKAAAAYNLIHDGAPAVANDTVNENSPAWKRARAGLTGGDIEDMVPHFARGGVVEGRGLALVGEDGPELIVPLDSFGAARRGAGDFGAGGGRPIVINLVQHFDGSKSAREMAQESAQAFRVEFVKALDEIAHESGGVGAEAA